MLRADILCLDDIRSVDINARDVVAEAVPTVAVYPCKTADVPLESFPQREMWVKQDNEPTMLARYLLCRPFVIVFVMSAEIVLCPAWYLMLRHHPLNVQPIIPIRPPIEKVREFPHLVGKEYNDGIGDVGYDGEYDFQYAI